MKNRRRYRGRQLRTRVKGLRADYQLAAQSTITPVAAPPVSAFKWPPWYQPVLTIVAQPGLPPIYDTSVLNAIAAAQVDSSTAVMLPTTAEQHPGTL